MTTTARKTCTRCCPATESWTNIHDRAESADGSPVWRCRCCGTEQPRRTRRSSEQIRRDASPAYAAAKDAERLALVRSLGVDEETIAALFPNA